MDQEQLKTLLRYEPETGEFYWLPKPESAFKTTRAWCSWKARYEGTRAGNFNEPRGYRRIKVAKRHYTEHRLAWLYVYGDWPPECIDHIDRDKTNNRIANLRLATPQQNCRNRIRKQKNSSGIHGVCYRARYKTWEAQIKVAGKCLYLGSFDNPDDAAAAYRAASIRYAGEFSPVR